MNHMEVARFKCTTGAKQGISMNHIFHCIFNYQGHKKEELQKNPLAIE